MKHEDKRTNEHKVFSKAEHYLQVFGLPVSTSSGPDEALAGVIRVLKTELARYWRDDWTIEYLEQEKVMYVSMAIAFIRQTDENERIDLATSFSVPVSTDLAEMCRVAVERKAKVCKQVAEMAHAANAKLEWY